MPRCSQCRKLFFFPSNLLRHVQTEHSRTHRLRPGDEPYRSSDYAVPISTGGYADITPSVPSYEGGGGSFAGGGASGSWDSGSSSSADFSNVSSGSDSSSCSSDCGGSGGD